MGNTHLSYSILENSGVFSDKPSISRFMILNLINNCSHELGAWEIRNKLQESELDVSSATVGRYLKELDVMGYTVKNSNKGRIITEEGKEYLDELNEQIMSSVVHKNVANAVDGTEYQDLRDIYHVRDGIESQSVIFCCRNASDEEIEAIGKSAEAYQERVEAKDDFLDVSLDFHVLIAKGSHNEFMENVLIMLIFEQKRIERKLKQLATRKEGKLFSQEHRQIYLALKDRNEELATELMHKHFESILKTMDDK